MNSQVKTALCICLLISGYNQLYAAEKYWYDLGGGLLVETAQQACEILDARHTYPGTLSDVVIINPPSNGHGATCYLYNGLDQYGYTVGVKWESYTLFDRLKSQNLECTVGNPIDPVSGSKLHKEEIINLNGINNISFVFYYDSMVAGGWSHEYDKTASYNYDGGSTKYNFNNTYILDADYVTQGQALNNVLPDGEIPKGKLPVSAGSSDTPESACSNWINFKSNYSFSWIPSSSTHYIGNGKCEVLADNQVKFVIDVYGYNQGQAISQNVSTDPLLPATITFKRENGSILEFVYDADSSEYHNTSNTGESAAIVDNGLAITEFLLVTNDDSVEHYIVDTSSKTARLASIEYINGNSIDLTYDGPNLTKITSAAGDYLELIYEAYGDDGLLQRLKTINDKQGRLWRFDYSDNNYLEFIHYPDGVFRKFIYGDQVNNQGLLTGIEDENGNGYAHWDYDSDHRAILSAHGNLANINRTTVNYLDGSTADVTVTRESVITGDNTSLTNQYRTNTVSNSPAVSEIKRIACIDCDNEKLVSGHNLQTGDVEYVENMGQRTDYSAYDNKGHPGVITEAAGTSLQRTRIYTYDSRYHGKISTITEDSVYPGHQKVTSYLYDDFGNNTAIIVNGFKQDGNSVSRTTSFEYNGPYHQLTLIDGPRTDVADTYLMSYYPDTEAEGDNRARLKSVTDPLGNELYTVITYTQSGKIQSYLSANNLQTTFTYYYGNDRLKSQELLDLDTGDKRLTEWTYLATGEVKTVATGDVLSDKTILTFNYDTSRRLSSIVDGLGNSIEYVLDTEGNVEQENIRDAAGNLKKQFNQTFDAYNRLQLRTQANEQLSEMWSPDGTLDKVIDGKNIITDYSYDNLRRLTQINQDMAGVSPQTAAATTVFDYDVQDNLTRVTNPVNGETTYTYDDLGNQLTRSSDDTGLTVYTYDDAGNVKTMSDANGETINYTYDALNRLTSITTSNMADDYSYEYDNCLNGAGRLCKISNSSYAQYYQYDAFGNITAHQALQYYYDSANRLESITYPSGATVQYSYDLAGHVQQLSLQRNGIVTPLAANLAYEPFGDVNNLVYGNGLTLTQSRDIAYRPLTQIIQDVLQFNYIDYDENGNLQQRDDAVANASSIFTYDAHNRLTAASGDFGTRSYTYDRNANRVSITDNGSITASTYEPQSNRLSMRGMENVTLDNNGNTLNTGAREYSYTKHNRLFQVFDNGELKATYYYSGAGQRISKTLADGSGKYFIYDTEGRLMAEADISGNILFEYIYLNGKLLAIYSPDMDSDGVSNYQEDQQGTNPESPDRDSDGITDLDEMFVYGTQVTIADTDGDGITDGDELAFNSNPRDANINYGDINLNGEFNLGDYVLLTQFVLGTRTPNPGEQQQADINHDGVLNIQDMLLMQRVLLGLQVSWIGQPLENLKSLFAKLYQTMIPPAYATNGDGELYYVHYDHLGTPLKLTNEYGLVVWQAIYDPFGKATVDDDVDGDGKSMEMNIRFPGQYYDAESGLHYNYHRYYDPDLGRYITSDPIGLAGGLNTYGYVGGNPVVFIDKYGLDFKGLIRERKRAKQLDPRYDLKEFVESNGFSHDADELLQRQRDLINGAAKAATKEGADAIYIPTLSKLKKLFGLDKPKIDPAFPKKIQVCE
ncbi:MAG: RHS domain-containing protein [Gammaproteobacteria bacterium]|nr:RHS domain-containing protein [Gammaproteobacteria bacterium]